MNRLSSSQCLLVFFHIVIQNKFIHYSTFIQYIDFFCFVSTSILITFNLTSFIYHFFIKCIFFPIIVFCSFFNDITSTSDSFFYYFLHVDVHLYLTYLVLFSSVPFFFHFYIHSFIKTDFVLYSFHTLFLVCLSFSSHLKRVIFHSLMSPHNFSFPFT